MLRAKCLRHDVTVIIVINTVNFIIQRKFISSLFNKKRRWKSIYEIFYSKMAGIEIFQKLTNKQLHAECLKHGLPNIPVTDSNRNILLKKLRSSIRTAETEDDLENLSNKELRAECLKYGLPNVPVTDSVRSVLIRKLRAAKANGISVKTNAVSEKPKSPVLNRRSINNHSVGSNVVKANTVKAKDNIKNKIEHVTRKQPSISSISPIVLSSSEDSLLSTSLPQTKPFRRSPSLSKSGVVTTSYTQEIEPLKRHVEYEDEEEEEEEEPIMVDESDNISLMDVDEAPIEQYQPAQSNILYHNTSTYDTSHNNPTVYVRPPLYSPSVAVAAQHTLSTSFESPIYTKNVTPNYYNHERLLNSTMNSNPPTNRITPPLARSSTYKTSNIAPAASPSKRHVSFGETYNVKPIEIKNPTHSPILYPSLNTFYEVNNAQNANYNEVRLEDDVSEEELSDEQIELSSEEEVDSGTSHYISPLARSLDNKNQLIRTRFSNTSNTVAATPRRPIKIHNSENEIWNSFYNFLNKLEERYHVKQSFALVMAFIVTVFIYVLFIH